MNIKSIVVCIIAVHSLLNGMEFKELKERLEIPYKSMSKMQRNQHHAQFRAACKQEFKRVWNSANPRSYKKSLEDLKNKNDFQSQASETYDQYLLRSMKNSYINTLTKYFPNDPLFDENKKAQLLDQARNEALDYIEGETCAGCCWLACAKV